MAKTNITNRLCETKVTERKKVYDAKCPGLYVFISTKGVATFYFKYWDGEIGKKVDVKVGEYHPDHLPVEEARTRCFTLRGRVGSGEDVAKTIRIAKTKAVLETGKKVGEIIDEYIGWMKHPVPKPDGERRPRVESWEGIAGYLNRFARPRLGDRFAAEVENDDIAKLQNDICNGKVARHLKPSVSNARNTRTSLSGMFNWAAEAGRKYVKMSPCVNLPKLDKENSRERVLSADEIKKVWWGLDHPDVPCTRAVALALKFELVTMLRSKEYVTATPYEVKGRGTKDSQFHIPLKRVKKRHIIVQPLSFLAEGILDEAITDQNQPHIFHINGAPLGRQALAHAVRGYTNKKGKVVRGGIYKFLGMKPWTPHDLRRTAATLAGDLKFTDAEIARCLDHAVDDGEDAAPTVTGTYVRSKRIEEKRKLIDAVDAALCKIIGKPPKLIALRA